MKLGICVPHYGRPIEIGRVQEVVRRAEERGLDSVWVTERDGDPVMGAGPSAGSPIDTV